MARVKLASKVRHRPGAVALLSGVGNWSAWTVAGLVVVIGIGLSNLTGCSSSTSDSSSVASNSADQAGGEDMENMMEGMGEEGPGGPGGPGMEMGGPDAEMGPGMGGPEGMEGMEEEEGDSEEGMAAEMAGMDPSMVGPPEGDQEEDQMEQEMAAMEAEMAGALGGGQKRGFGRGAQEAAEAGMPPEMEGMQGPGLGPDPEGIEAEMGGPEGPGFGLGGPEGGPGMGPGMGRGMGGGRPSFPKGSPQAAIFDLVMQLRGEAKPEELVKVISADAKGDLAELRDGKASDEKRAALKTLVERVKFVGRPRKLPGGKLQLVLENVNAKKLIRFICRHEGDGYVIQEMHVMQATRRGRGRRR